MADYGTTNGVKRTKGRAGHRHEPKIKGRAKGAAQRPRRRCLAAATTA